MGSGRISAGDGSGIPGPKLACGRPRWSWDTHSRRIPRIELELDKIHQERTRLASTFPSGPALSDDSIIDRYLVLAVRADERHEHRRILLIAALFVVRGRQ